MMSTNYRRTVIFGGSFSPVHNGHIGLATYLIKEGLADEVCLMVSPHNPLKPTTDLWPDETRLHLARLAIEGIEGVNVSDFEFSLPRPSYTWRTLKALSQACPERDFSLLIGADNWTIFDQWSHVDEIRAHYPIFIYPRQGYSIDETILPSSVKYLRNAPFFPLSSTEIRKRLKAGEDCSTLVSPKILEYLKKTENAPLIAFNQSNTLV